MSSTRRTEPRPGTSRSAPSSLATAIALDAHRSVGNQQQPLFDGYWCRTFERRIVPERKDKGCGHHRTRCQEQQSAEVALGRILDDAKNLWPEIASKIANG